MVGLICGYSWLLMIALMIACSRFISSWYDAIGELWEISHSIEIEKHRVFSLWIPDFQH